MSGMEGHNVVCRETFKRDFARLSPDPFFLGTRGRRVMGGYCSRLVQEAGVSSSASALLSAQLVTRSQLACDFIER